MKINYTKRREVMERSMRLGHCICEPRRPCPCDVFKSEGICPCAGERPDPIDFTQLKLTSLARNPGCASKIAPGDLEQVLSRLPAVSDSAVISGLAAADDAAIYRIHDDLCLVQTVDVFTPCVDDPRLFGRICAANCLSDIYAMGGVPKTALSIVAYPSESLPGEPMCLMLTGAMETFKEAGVALIGGHSIKDEEIKLGFAITGLIDPARAAALDSPTAGDALILTKPLGTGVLAFAQQVGRPDDAGMAAAIESMATLNRSAAEAMLLAGASACTDITGFGLFGHLARMLRQKRLSARLFADALPAFPGVMELLRHDVIPGAVERNREFVGEDLSVAAGVEPARVHLGLDAQTSGGLLIAISPARESDLLRALGERNVPAFAIGVIAEAAPSLIRLCAGKSASVAEPLTSLPFSDLQQPKPLEAASANHGPDCCADIFSGPAQVSSSGESQRAFNALMRSAQAPGVLDAKTRELIMFALVLQSRCEPCFAAHLEKARELGITQAELDETAWSAVAMGGAPVKMFYQENMKAVRQQG